MTKNEDLKALTVYDELFSLVESQTGKVLLHSEMNDIINVVEKYSTRPTVTDTAMEARGECDSAPITRAASTTDGDAERQKIIVSKMRNLLSMYLSMWKTARSQARDFGSREMVKEFNGACTEGARIQGQIEQYFAVKTIDEAQELLEIFGGKVAMSP